MLAGFRSSIIMQASHAERKVFEDILVNHLIIISRFLDEFRRHFTVCHFTKNLPNLLLYLFQVNLITSSLPKIDVQFVINRNKKYYSITCYVVCLLQKDTSGRRAKPKSLLRPPDAYFLNYLRYAINLILFCKVSYQNVKACKNM